VPWASPVLPCFFNPGAAKTDNSDDPHTWGRDSPLQGDCDSLPGS
jgi:hypothetical protein